jgi:hypothetical protein
VTCGTSCLSNLSLLKLSPTVTSVRTGQLIGIFVARVTGSRKLFGRTVPRIRPVGRVPLGAIRRGRNSFRWNGKVDGKRLRAGTYLITYRTLRGKRILSTSDSLRVKVDRRGRIKRATRQR